MMIVLVGKTASGKSTVADIIEQSYKMKRIRTYTTRPARDGEGTNEYHFISDDEFKKMKDEGFFFETTDYVVASGATWHYGTAKKDLSDDYSCIVMNPSGMKKILHMTNDNIDPIVIYLNVTEGCQWVRLRERGCDADEAQRRIKADNEDFSDIEDYYDFAFTTDNLLPNMISDMIIEANKHLPFLKISKQ